MNKKLVIGIIAMVTAVLAITGVGAFFLLRAGNTAETGNKLGVEWYDVSGKEFTINTADELYEFAKLSTYYDFKDQTVKLGADIVVNEGNAEEWGEKAPARKWSPILDFAGTFDGQGHTISGIYVKGYNNSLALFANPKGSCVVKDFKLTNSYFEAGGFGGVASIVSGGGGTFSQIYSDAIVKVTGGFSGFSGGIASKMKLATKFDQCWYDGVIITSGRDAGGIIDAVASNVTISHCLFSGKIEGTWDANGSRTGGLVGKIVISGTNLTLEDSLSTGTVESGHTSLIGSVLGASYAETSLKTTDTYGSVDSYKSAIGSAGSNGNIHSAPLEVPGDHLIGVKAYQWTNLDFDKYWSVVEEDTPVLKCFAESSPSLDGIAKAYDAKWYGPTGGVITNAEQLYGFYILSGSTNFKGKSIKLGNDITFNEGKAESWLKEAPTNIWYQVTGFAGTFDGQGHTINGLYINTDGRYVGFFKSTTMEACVKNLSIKNSLISNHSEPNAAASTGTVAGLAHGKFENIYSDAILDVNGTHIGGLFGQSYQKTTISNCWFDGKISNTNGRYTGGILGAVTGSNVTVEHCLNTAPIDIEYEAGYVNAGGIVGATLGGSGIILNIKDCLNVGTITSTKGGLGAVIGHVVSGTVNISDTYAVKGSNAKDGKAVGHVQGGVKGGVVTLNEEMLTGYLAYDWSTLDFEKYWSVVKTDTPILKTWATNSPSVAGRQKAFDISWYDATQKEYVIKNMQQLYGFYIMSGTTNFKGKTVKLGANITLNSGDAKAWKDAAPKNIWFPIMDFAGTFDGQGHTISGMYVNTGVRYSGFFGTTTKDAVVKNFSLKNSIVLNSMSGMASTGSIAGAGHGTFEKIYSDAIVIGSREGIGGLIGQVYQPTKVSNCWYDGELTVEGRYSGGIVGAMTGSIVTIEHCLNTGTINVTQKSGYVNSGGIIGACYYGDNMKLTISDCLNVGDVITNQGGTGAVIGHVVKGETVIENTYAVADSNKKSGVGVGHVQGTLTGDVTQFPETMLKGLGAVRVSYLDFNKYWAAIADKTPQLKAFTSGGLNTNGVAKLYDTSWYDPNKTEYLIRTKEQLYGLAQVSKNTDFAGKTVKLANDITFNTGNAIDWLTNTPEYAWIPINDFAGTFDGQGYAIKGLYVSRTANAGLFKTTTKDAVIKHLKMENSVVLGTTNTGTIAGTGGGKFYGIYSNAIVSATENQVGGILGYATKDAAFELVQFDGHAVTERNQVGGMIGLVNNAVVTMKNCHVSGIVETTTTSGHMNMGMMVGRVVGTSDVTMEGCLLNGYMKHNHPGATNYDNRLYANRFVGKMEGKNAWLDVQNTVYIGDAEHWPTYVGHTQGSAAGAIWKNPNTAKSLLEEQLIGAKAWFNSKLPFYMNMSDVTAGKAYVAVVDEMPVLKIFAEGKIIDNLNEYVQADTKWFTSGIYEGTRTNPYVISDAGDLAGLSELVNAGNTFKDKYIILDDDIVYNAGAPSTLDEWKNYKVKNIFTPIGQPGDTWNANAHFAGTFDGQGHTISGIYVADPDGERWAGLFGATTDSAVIKNFKLLNTYIEGHQQVAAISGRGGGTFSSIETNAIVICSADGKYVGNTLGGILGQANAAKVVIEKCHFYGMLQGEGASVAGILGAATGASTVDIEESAVSGTVSGPQQVAGLVATISGSNVTATDCHVSGTVISTTTTGHMNTGMAAGIVSGKSLFTLRKSLVNGTMQLNRDVRDYANAYVGKVSGANAYIDIQYSNIVTENIPSANRGLSQAHESSAVWKQGHTSNGVTTAQLTGPTAVLHTKGLSYCANADDTSSRWVATKAGTPKLRIFAEKEEIADVSAYVYESHGWYTSGEHEGTKNDPYVISKPGELIAMSYAVISGAESFEGKYIALGADIAINENAPSTEAGWASYASPRVWTQIGNPVNQFKGTFDGQGHSVSGIYMKGTGTNVGLFGYTAASSAIKNLKVVNSYFEGSQNVGGVTGSGGGTYENVSSNAIVKATSQCAGGIIGLTNANASFTKCHFAGEVTSAGNFAGGITSRISSLNVNFTECLMTGKAKAVQRVGGFLGQTDGTAKIKFTDCMTTGTTTSTNGGHSQHGGFVGYALGTSIVEIARGVMAGKMVCTNQNYTRPFVGKVEGGAQFSGAEGAYLIQDADFYPLDLGFIGTLSLTSGNDGWLSSPGSGCVRITKEQMTGENAVTSMPKLNISTAKDGTSTWVATKNGFPTLRFFAKEADILTK